MIHALAYAFKMIELAKYLKGKHTIREPLGYIVRGLLMLELGIEGDTRKPVNEISENIHPILEGILHSLNFKKSTYDFNNLYEVYKSFIKTQTLNLEDVYKIPKIREGDSYH